jgi:hypothetical protein
MTFNRSTHDALDEHPSRTGGQFRPCPGCVKRR